MDSSNHTGHDSRKTDIFAILAFATSLLGFLIFPIIFVPACYIFCIVSKYRLRENKHLKGTGLLICAWLFGVIELLYSLKIGPFSEQ